MIILLLGSASYGYAVSMLCFLDALCHSEWCGPQGQTNCSRVGKNVVDFLSFSHLRALLLRHRAPQRTGGAAVTDYEIPRSLFFLFAV